MLDCHFALGQTRILVAGEPDFLAGACHLLAEAGAKVAGAIATVDSPQLEQPAGRTGRWSATSTMPRNCVTTFDLIIGNGHVEALAHRYHKGVVLRGFPDWETFGNQLKNDVLYEGGTTFLFEVANAAERMRRAG